MIKKFENYDYEEEDDESPYEFVGFYIMREFPTDNSFFIMEENINENHIVLYNQYQYKLSESVWKYCRYVTKEHIKEYIYSNKLPVNIYDKDQKNDNDRADGWKKVFWKDLPKWIKDNL